MSGTHVHRRAGVRDDAGPGVARICAGVLLNVAILACAGEDRAPHDASAPVPAHERVDTAELDRFRGDPAWDAVKLGNHLRPGTPVVFR